MITSAAMVGRADDLSTALDLMARAADGDAGFVVVAGDAGVGKTRFAREVATRARSDGWTVLIGECAELSDGVAPLAPIAAVLRQLARDRGDAGLARLLHGPARWLAPLVPELGIDAHALARESPGQVLVSFHRLLRELADEGPVLLVLEDLHWADPTTRDVVRQLASRLQDERLLVLGTVRTDDLGAAHPLRPVLAELARRPGVQRLDLAPLDAVALTRHLATLTGGRHRPDLGKIVERSQGNPFFAEELLAIGDEEKLPPSLQEVLSLRLERLPADAQRLLGEAAVLGGTVDPTLLERVTGLDEPRHRHAIRAALDDGVLLFDGSGFTFRHALLREVALSRLLPDERRSAHAAAATALESAAHSAVVDRAGMYGRAARHWWDAGDLPRCLVASVTAAAEATDVFASALALRHIRRAIALWDEVSDPEQLTGTAYHRLLLSAARAARDTDDPSLLELGAAAMRSAAGREDAYARAEAAYLYAWGLVRFGRAPEAVDVAAGERAQHGQERTMARALALLAHASATIRAGEGMDGDWDLDAVAGDLEEALAIAREHGDRDVERMTLTSIVDLVGPYLADMTDMALTGLAALSDEEQTHGAARELAFHWAARHAYLCGRFAEAGASLNQWRAFAASSANRGAHWSVVERAIRIYVDAWSGHLDEALRQLDEVDVHDYDGSPPWTLWLAWAAGDALRWTGRISRALDHAQLAEAAGDAGYHRIWFAAERAASRAAAGTSAREVIAGARVTIELAKDRGWPWAMPRLVAAVATASGERQLDEDLLAVVDGWLGRLERYVAWLPADAPIGPWAASCLQRARAERDDAAGLARPEGWDPVVSDLDSRGAVPDAAIARLRRASARAAADGASSPEFERDLKAAWQTFEDLGMTALQVEASALAHRLRVRLPDHLDDDDGADEVLPALTDRERQVLILIAQGWSNQHIGEHLFISPKTVSVHLSNTMRKIGVGSRTEAAAVAHRVGLTVWPASESKGESKPSPNVLGDRAADAGLGAKGDGIGSG